MKWFIWGTAVLVALFSGARPMDEVDLAGSTLERGQVTAPAGDHPRKTARSAWPNYVTVCPEDFEGASTAEKVRNANAFVLAAGGRCVFYFGKSREYLIERSLILPSDTGLVVDNCRIRLADRVHDNIIRTANVIPGSDSIADLAKYMGFCEISGALSNIWIIGQGKAVLSGPVVRHEGPRNLKDRRRTEYVGDRFGWRGESIYLHAVKNYEICGLKIERSISWSCVNQQCSFGKIHDMSYDNHGQNGDGVDLFGCHDVEVFNLDGFTQDDGVAICTTSAARDAVDPFPVLAVSGGDYTYGKDAYNINIHHICTAGNIGHQVILLSNGPKIHDIHIAGLSEPAGSRKKGILRFYGYVWPYTTGYVEGCYDRIFATDIDGLHSEAAVVIDDTKGLEAMPSNSIINKVKRGRNGTWFSRSDGNTRSTGVEIGGSVFTSRNCKKTNLIH